MREMRYKQAIAVASTLLLLLFMLPACSEETAPEIPEAKTAKLTILLGTTGSSRPAYTKAADAGFDPDEGEVDEYERHIDDWYLVVLKTDGTVDQVLSSEKGDIAIPEGSDLDSRHHIGVELAIDETYRFYAFANLESLHENNFASKYILGLNSGEQFKLATEALLKPVTDYQIPAAGQKATHYIPMSSYAVTATVQKEQNQAIEIPLIRLLGKVEVTVNNATGNEITLNRLSLGNFRTSGDIYLLPYDAAEGNGTTNLLDRTQENILAPSFPTDAQGTHTEMELVETPVTIAANSQSPAYWSYANETSFIEANNAKALQITADITGRNSQPLETGFDFIRRNDHLVIPLLISDIETEISFNMQHMPIGGLPTTIAMPAGVTLPIATYWTQDHGGDITITYTLGEVSSLSNTKLKHYTSGDSWRGNTNKHPFTSATLQSNSSDLLINVPEDKTAAPWLAEGIQAYPLTPGNDGNSGSFTVTTQELANAAEASIDLTLVIEGTAAGNETKTLVVPYTIIIKNKNQKGGNE